MQAELGWCKSSMFWSSLKSASFKFCSWVNDLQNSKKLSSKKVTSDFEGIEWDCKMLFKNVMINIGTIERSFKTDLMLTSMFLL